MAVAGRNVARQHRGGSLVKKAVFLLVLVCLAVACGQKKQAPAPDANTVLAGKVKTEFLHAWQGYKQYAWSHDMLKPLSKTSHDWYGVSLLMTPVDAFDTMKLMGLEAEAREAKELIFERLSFDNDIDVQLFEINIRLLGGLLSAYQLDGDKRFLDLAADLGRRLLPAFDSPTGMPYRIVNLRSGATGDPHNNPAEIGTLLLEFGTLSRTTGDEIYYEKAKHAVQTLFNRRSSIGLVGTIINIETGEWENTESHLGGRIDSYYEYLLTSWLLFGYGEMKEMWDSSITAINAYLEDSVASGYWYGRADMTTANRTRRYFGALDAFFPAVLTLSGDTARARKLQESCFKMWMLYGIEPEMIDYSVMEIVSESYVLRPETIESAYYLYRSTRDPRFLEMGTEYFESLVEHCRSGAAYAALKSVKTMEQ
ncbi:MAG: glycoside hydrolase family 47 protein, partial [Chitinivibrionia bacterium]|nr:glycoside hydrolase family 47 protein [Chitinivibrionia bacterium]